MSFRGQAGCAVLSSPLAVFFTLALIVWGAVSLENRFQLFRSLGSALVAILVAMAFSNAGLIPGESSAYAFLGGPAVSVGIALILLSVDVRSVLEAGPTMLIAFAVGAVGTALGATVSAFVLVGDIGPETWKLAGQYTGTYTGGGMNFAAVGTALDTSSDLFTAGIAADVIVTAIWMATCLIVPVLMSGSGGQSTTVSHAEGPTGPASRGAAGARSTARRADGQGAESDDEVEAGTGTLERRLYGSGGEVSLSDLALIATLALGVYWCADLLGARFAPIPSILFLTTIALVLAQVPAIKGIPGAAVMGNYLVLLFLASNGARSVIANIVDVGPPIFYFALITVSIHGIVIFGVGRLLKIEAGTLAVASQANVGGAASAIALATARGDGDRLLPGVAVGLLGYAVGNYAGLAVAFLLRPLLLG